MKTKSKYLLFLVALCAATTLFAQHKQRSTSWKDTTFIPVTLSDTSKDKKIVIIDIGEKATIYLRLDLLRQNAIEIKNDFNNIELTRFIYLLDRVQK